MSSETTSEPCTQKVKDEPNCIILRLRQHVKKKNGLVWLCSPGMFPVGGAFFFFPPPLSSRGARLLVDATHLYDVISMITNAPPDFFTSYLESVLMF